MLAKSCNASAYASSCLRILRVYRRFSFRFSLSRAGFKKPASNSGCNVITSPVVSSTTIRTSSDLYTTPFAPLVRSEEHTSELQSRGHLVCRLLLEKKKKKL